MKERNKPTKSFIARSIEEIEKEAFKEGCEAGKKETIEKACEWLFATTYDYLNEKEQEKVAEFVKAMEENYGTTRLQD